MQAIESKEYYLSAFRRVHSPAPAWLNQLRESAIGRFNALGFPTTRNEEWKYTNVDPIVAIPFARANGQAKTVSSDEIFSVSFTDFACNRLVFVNGDYIPQFSSLRELPQGVVVRSLAETLKHDEQILQPYLARNANYQEEAFIALNTAFMADGAVVVIPEGCRLEEPIYLVFVSVPGQGPVASYPRNLIILKHGSEAKVVETYVGLGAGAYFVDAVTELIGEENTIVEHYRLQRETASGFHVGALDAHLGRTANCTAHAITLGGSLVRNGVHVVLGGEGSECALNGLYLMDGKQHVDNHTEIEHVQPRATSLELYKGILSGSARGVFNGKIIVHKDAQKTDARQTNKNLLLSEGAVVNTKPQLEIHADDVKCSHGSTIGQLDPDALFYLRSRGIGLDDAQSLLSYGFASDVVSRIRIPRMRARLDDFLLTKFGRK
ncbi:MAG TPA: Fe-S cluster assembly protein SufD [Candidatus Udaeobacter sp.]|nr:Fe-S cluster assembly protein SufD [Candidatus Udaeobacter sp.]